MRESLALSEMLLFRLKRVRMDLQVAVIRDAAEDPVKPFVKGLMFTVNWYIRNVPKKVVQETS
jgi:hypothetical protein